MSFTERFKSIDWETKKRQASHAASVAREKARELASHARAAIHEATAPSGHVAHAPHVPQAAAVPMVAYEPVAHVPALSPAKAARAPKKTWIVNVQEDGEETVLDEFKVRASSVDEARSLASDEAEKRGWTVQYAGHDEERGNGIFVYTRTAPRAARAQRKANERRLPKGKGKGKRR